MSTWDGKKGQLQQMELWIERWRSFAAEKGFKGRHAVWAFLEFLQNPAVDKLHRRMGARMQSVDDPEILIKELRMIYDERGNFRRVREEFLTRDQAKGESLRDYMDALYALHQEADSKTSTKSRNEAVYRRFHEGLTDPELIHPGVKRRIDAYAHKLEEEQEDYLELILRDAEAEKISIRNSNRELSKSEATRKPLKAIEEVSDAEEASQASSGAELPKTQKDLDFERMQEVLSKVQVSGAVGGCFHCGEAGHFARLCPLKLAGKAPTEKGKELHAGYRKQKEDEEKDPRGRIHLSRPASCEAHDSNAGCNAPGMMAFTTVQEMYNYMNAQLEQTRTEMRNAIRERDALKAMSAAALTNTQGAEPQSGSQPNILDTGAGRQGSTLPQTRKASIRTQPVDLEVGATSCSCCQRRGGATQTDSSEEEVAREDPSANETTPPPPPRGSLQRIRWTIHAIPIPRSYQ